MPSHPSSAQNPTTSLNTFRSLLSHPGALPSHTGLTVKPSGETRSQAMAGPACFPRLVSHPPSSCVQSLFSFSECYWRSTACVKVPKLIHIRAQQGRPAPVTTHTSKCQLPHVAGAQPLSSPGTGLRAGGRGRPSVLTQSPRGHAHMRKSIPAEGAGPGRSEKSCVLTQRKGGRQEARNKPQTIHPELPWGAGRVSAQTWSHLLPETHMPPYSGLGRHSGPQAAARSALCAGQCARCSDTMVGLQAKTCRVTVLTGLTTQQESVMESDRKHEVQV